MWYKHTRDVESGTKSVRRGVGSHAVFQSIYIYRPGSTAHERGGPASAGCRVAEQTTAHTSERLTTVVETAEVATCRAGRRCGLVGWCRGGAAGDATHPAARGRSSGGRQTDTDPAVQMSASRHLLQAMGPKGPAAAHCGQARVGVRLGHARPGRCRGGQQAGEEDGEHRLGRKQSVCVADLARCDRWKPKS